MPSLETLGLYHPLSDMGGTDARALGIINYKAMMYQFFAAKSNFSAYLYSESGDGTIGIGDYQVAEADSFNYTPGTQVAGENKPKQRLITVTPDALPIMSASYVADAEKWLSHLDITSTRHMKHNEAVRKEQEIRSGVTLVRSARKTAVGTVGTSDYFPGGFSVEVDEVGSTLAAIFPDSIVGAKRIRGYLADLAEYWDDRSMPEDNRIAFITPYIRRVLAHDTTLVSIDYSPVNYGSTVTRKLLECEGFKLEVVPSTCYPNKDFSSLTTTEQDRTRDDRYKYDCSKTAFLAICGMEAVKQLTYQGGIQMVGPERSASHQSELIGTQVLQGLGEWHAEYAAEFRFKS